MADQYYRADRSAWDEHANAQFSRAAATSGLDNAASPGTKAVLVTGRASFLPLFEQVAFICDGERSLATPSADRVNG